MLKLIPLFLLIFLFQGCTNNDQPQVSKMFQTNGATLIHQNYNRSIKNLLKYQLKLNARNPQNYNKNIVDSIQKEIKNSSTRLDFYNLENKKLTTYQDFLNIAFDKNPIVNRNDYLIMGIFKLLYDAFEMQSNHKFTGLSYDTKKMQNAYQLMKIIQWKIKNDKDNNNVYLFNTWQNNWQLELDKRITRGETPSWEMIENLKFIKEKKETIFDPSNHSFEILTNQIIENLDQTIRILGEEPTDLAIEAISFFIFL